jgi:exosortase
MGTECARIPVSLAPSSLKTQDIKKNSGPGCKVSIAKDKLKSFVSTAEGCALAALAACVAWAYWPTFADLLHQWTHESNYSHGFLVPGFAGVLLWLRRDKASGIIPGFYSGGLVLLAAAGLMRFVAAYTFFDWLEAFSLVPCLAGLVYLIGGRKALGWTWPGLCFLVFMIPLPFRADKALALPLQRIATIASTYFLQTAGIPALSEGNVIVLSNEVRLGVVEACSGLGMLVTFLALSTGMAMVIRRPALDRWVIFASAVPIAIISNVVRISVTGILYQTAGQELADLVFHDLAGFLMPVLGLAILGLELKLLSCVLVDAKKSAPIHIPVPPSKKPAAKGPVIVGGVKI